MTELIITSSVLILVVIVLRHFLKGKISLRLQYALWALVLLRLLVPVSLFESPISVMNAVQAVKSALVVSVASAPAPTFSSAYGDIGVENAAVQGGVGQNVTDTVTNVTHHVFRWGLLAQWVWYIGIGIVEMTLLLSNLSFGRKLKKTRKEFPADDCKLPVYTVDTLPSPCLFGLLRPSIYITSEVAGDEMKLRHVLAHELTHYRHGDYIWSALRCLCIAVHWYNPLVWLAAALSRRDSELACDEGTIKRIGEESRMEYGRTLIGLTCEKRKAMDLLSTATTMTEGKKGIKERITLIAKKPKLLLPAVVAVALVGAVAVGCTFTGAKLENAEITPLTAEELEQYNKAFEPLLYDEKGDPISVNPISQFLTSYYDRPEDINLAELLRYFPSDGDVTDNTEFEALKSSENWPFGADVTLDDMPVPVHKFSADTVNKALKKYMGITLDNLSGTGMDELVYRKDYDAYYNFTSDAGFGSFTCTSGEKQGDIVRLFGETATLTLRMQCDGFLIVSHQLTDGAAGGGKENKDVTLYGCGGLSVAIPNEYIGKLVVIADPKPEAAENGLLISVYEKQSYEESLADNGNAAGFLFSIVRYTQAQYEQFLCSDGSGYSFFAKDNTYYYGWFVATDVQFYRSGMGSLYTNSDEWKEWQTLNQKCNAIKDDFTARNHLTAFSDSEFQSKQFTYDSEHLYFTYYPYYAYQDTATAQGFTWQDVAYKLVLSQPAKQGKTGIWCVERWYDEHGSLYLYFPNANGVPAAQYYAEEQAQCDAGHKVSALDPNQVALEFVRQYFGHTEASLKSISVQNEPSANKELIASADINNDGQEEAFYLDKSRMDIDSGDCVTLRVFDSDGNEIWSEDAGGPHAGWNSLFLYELDGKHYILRYNPYMGQGYCTYTYTLFTLEGGSEKVYQTKSLEFDINGTKALDAPQMVAFADEVNALLAKSTLLLSSEGGAYSFGPASADGFMEEFSWLEEDPNLESLYLQDDDLQTKLEKFSEHAVSNHG